MSELQEQVKKVIAYSQGFKDAPHTDILLEQWQSGKSLFINQLDGDLIYEYPETVTFSLSPVERNNFLDNFYTWLENRDLLSSLFFDFLEANRNSFYDNRVSSTYTFGGDNVTIQAGSKLVRSFKYFVPESELREVQDYASELIQRTKITGKICISVHPLDFLSISENNSNWRSCHSLDGGYRAGNLAYMIDKCTVVAYIRSEQDEILPNFPQDVPWNNKKWRMLIFFSKDHDMVFAGRQYPFESKEILKFIGEHLLPKISSGNKNYTVWSNYYIQEENLPPLTDYSTPRRGSSVTFYDFPLRDRSRYFPVRGAIKEMEEVIQDSGLAFNDLLHSDSYIKPYYAYAITSSTWRGSYISRGNSNTISDMFPIGTESVICPCCGKFEIQHSDTLFCSFCEEEGKNG